MELKTTLYDVDGGVATITLHRPHRRNAWTGRMHTEFRHLLGEANEDPAVRVAILTGSGDSFCVGADFKALTGHVERGGYDSGTDESLPMPGYGVRPEFDQNFAFMQALEIPIIAAVNGAAAGVGLVAACYSDLRFAVTGARMTTAHGPLGLPAEYGLSWLLPRLIGVTRAADLLLSSRKFLSDEVADWGLFNAVVPPDELMPMVNAYAHDLATRVAPSSLRMTKRQLWLDQMRDVGSAVAEADELLEEAMRGDDYREGARAIVEKRPPEFS